MLIHRFEQQVNEHPDKIAVKTENGSLTYSGLDTLSDRAAGAIHAASPGGGRNPVGLLMDHAPEMIASILGVLKTGNVYVPMVADFPVKRLQYIIGHAGIKIFITDNKNRDRVHRASGGSGKILLIEDIKSGAAGPGTAFNRETRVDDDAYILYTSGSTGTPKGVRQTHRNILSFALRYTRTLGLTPEDNLTLFSSFSHDASVMDIYTALLNGMTLFPLDLKKEGIFTKLPRWLRENNITVWHSVPTVFRYFLGEVEGSGNGGPAVGLPGLRYVVLGGEAVLKRDIQRFRNVFSHFSHFSHCRLYNLYGQTESTYNSGQFFDARPGGDGEDITVTLGEEIEDTRLYVVDNDGDEAGTLEAGEIVVVAPHVSPGYWKDETANNEKFAEDEEGRVYFTGDLGRRLPDGRIEYLGRKDNQVKIRGFRVEPGEIESTVMLYDHIDQAAVIPVENQSTEIYLACFFSADRDIDLRALGDFLRERLSDYMVPSYFRQLTRFPVTVSGKIDRKALPKPDFSPGSEYVPPRDELERKLVDIWADILAVGKEVIGINGNFFRLGGHSLRAALLTSRIHKELNVKVPLAMVFDLQTVKGLAGYIRGAGESRYHGILPAEKREYYPASAVQRQMYFVQQLDPGGIGYNIPYIFVLGSQTDRDRLAYAFTRLIRRYEILRTGFHVLHGEVVQRIVEYEKIDFSLDYHECTDDDARGLYGNFSRSFDLSRPPLVRAALFNVDGTYSLAVDFHHIIADNITLNLLEADFIALYNGNEPPDVALHYKDYALWQNSPPVKQVLKKQEGYWLNAFRGELPVLELPYDFPRPPVQTFRGSASVFVVPEEVTRSLKETARANDSTLYMVLLAVFDVLLSRLGGSEDIIVGAPAAVRGHAELRDMAGMLVNTIPIRTYVSPGNAFQDLLAEVKQNTLAAFENREYPFDELVGKLLPRMQRDPGRNPLFDVMFNLLDERHHKAEGVELNEQIAFDFLRSGSIFDLTLTAGDRGGKIVFRYEYSTALFKPGTMERFFDYFKRLLTLLSAAPGTRLSEIDMLTESERRQLLYEFNGTEHLRPSGATIHGWFQKRAAATPDRIALHMSHKTHMTYAELNKRSNRLAFLLRENGVGPDAIVGISVERSPEMIAGILAILKAGGAYLPIDAGLPAERKNYMIRESGLEVLLSNERNGSAVTLINPGNEAIYRGGSTNPMPKNSPSDLVYVIYTSGSTGKPKGVMVEHRNVENLLQYHFKYTDIDCSKILQFTTIGFDVAFQEIFSAFLSGGTLYLIEEAVRTDIPVLFSHIAKNEIKTVFLPMSLLKLVFREDDYTRSFPRCVRHIVTAGERVVVSDKFRNYLKESHTTLHNHYGPAETHVVTTLTLDPDGDIPEFPPIGRPVSNTSVYILDNANHLLPIGVPGELYIGGIQVGRGYLGRDDLTRERFLSNPFVPGERMYRTGDLARWMADGNIVFLGRADHQVKIRGFRVELGEIESRLSGHPGVKECVAVAHKDAGGDMYLCAYIVPGHEHVPAAAELGEFLSEALPEYMIPAHFVFLEEIPLTPSGKIDRMGLPAPVLKTDNAYIAPRNEIEEKLAILWAEVLGIEKEVIGIEGNFFQLGGHSLKAAVLASRIHKTFDVILPLAEMLKRPTIESAARYIASAAESKFVSLEPVEKKEYYPLSPAQKRLFILQQMETGSMAYNMPVFIEPGETPDTRRLEAVFKKLIARHESLRTSFHLIGGEPVQKVHDRVEFGIENSVFPRPFDLSKAPLIRVGLMRSMEREDAHVLAVDMHHIVSDGLSLAVLEQEFDALYRDLPLAPLRIQYKDYALWKSGRAEKEAAVRMETYWLNVFEGEIPVLELPADFPRPAVRSFEGGSCRFETGARETRGLIQIARREEATLFMVMTAIIHIFLSRLSGEEDIVVGTPDAGRGHADLERVIGMFVNTLALRNYPGGGKRFCDFLAGVKSCALKAFENREYPFEELVEKIAVKRDTGRNPLFDVMFSFLERGTVPMLPGSDDRPVYGEPPAKFDLTVTGTQIDDKFLFTFQYWTKLFKAETIRRFTVYFKNIVSAVVEDPGIKLSEIEILPEVEKNHLLYDFNNTAVELPVVETIHALFEEQAARTPGNIAVVEKNHSLTYRELDNISGRLACRLSEKGVRPGSIAAVKIDQSIDMVIGILAVLKAGGAYLPIDTGLPEERIAYMLKDSGAVILLSELRELRELRELGGCVEKIKSQPAQPCYIIYTSGTTGRPKGTVIEHRSLVNLCRWHNRRYSITARDRATKYAGTGFDASVWEMFPYLVAGASITIVEEEIKADIYALNRSFERNGITVAFLPTQLCEQFMALDNRSLRILLTGGDKLRRFIKRDYVLVNNYGPTENTVVTTSFTVEGQSPNIPIGKPVDNTALLVLDRYGRLQPAGAAGELCISGAGLARGYLNNPELTAERFSRGAAPSKSLTPYRQSLPLTPLYRTGDRARWLPDGSLEFLGRIDRQVKVRGFRIELAEIENHLLAHDTVNEAAVVDWDTGDGDKYLCAYIVSGGDVDIAALKNSLSSRLPRYMIPSHFKKIEKIPLTPNGKIDRKRLPLIEIETRKAHTAPRNHIEEKLVETWAGVLSLPGPSIGIDDNFFELGGHSLRATILLTKIHEELEVKLSLAEVFKNQTVRDLAECIGKAKKQAYAGIDPVEKRDYYPLSSAQKRLFFLQQMEPESTAYNIPVVFPLGKNVQKDKLESALRQLIDRHESLRTSFQTVNGTPVQRVHDDVTFGITYCETRGTHPGASRPPSQEGIGRIPADNPLLRGVPEGRGVSNFGKSPTNEFVNSFDLSKAPLMRSVLIRLPDDGYVWMVDIHHIVSDGTSHSVLIEDFTALYEGEELGPLRLQYKDFSQWQNRLFESGVIEPQEDYWLRLYSGDIPRLDLPVDFKRPGIFSFSGDRYEFKLDRDDAVKFRALGARNGATLYMNIRAALVTLFYRYTGQTDIVIGTGIAGRPHADLQRIIGMFVNTLAMRDRPHGEKTYESFLKEVAAGSVEAFENQDVQFEELVDKLNLERDASRNPLFDIMMVVQNFRQAGGGTNEESLAPIDYRNVTSKFDMTFFVHEEGVDEGDVAVLIEYYTEIFKRETVARFVRHFKKLIKEVVEAPGTRLDTVDILPGEEKQQLLYRFNDTHTDYPREKTLPQIFEEQVLKKGDNIAAVSGDRCLTYKVLDEEAGRVAGYLYHAHGIGPGLPVGLLVDRSLSMIVSILGILKAGGVYVPLSPSFPEERLKTMIDDTGMGVLIGHKRYIKTLNRVQWECESLDTYLCIDSEDVRGEDETESSELMNPGLWEYVGRTSVDEVTGGGWNSSYTGEPIPKAEMDEYGDNILKKLEPLLHKNMRVLEIGAASGISMYRLAPKVGFYCGTDLSRVIIEKNARRIEEEGHTNIKLSCLAAHEIDRLDERDFDLVVINSVIQCFNGHNYLRKVIRRVIDLMGEGGVLFIGDIMDLDLKKELIADLGAFKQSEKGKGYKTKLDWSEELFISRSFLLDLRFDFPEIQDIEFSGKIHTLKNELTEFRYDALIRIDKTKKRGEIGRRHKHRHDIRALRAHDGGRLRRAFGSDNPAYIIYTSGSTGVPKGTLTTHYNVSRVVKDTNYIEFLPGDRVLQLSDYAFDGSVFDIYGALLNGLPLVTVSREELLEIGTLSSLIKRERITVFFITASLFNTLVDLSPEGLSHVRKVIFGGERASVKHVEKALGFLGKGRLLNGYGPTETTVFAAVYSVDEITPGQTSIPIGAPISNTVVYILDSRSNPVPIGVNGEIHIGGPGVCKGYLNNPELTAEVFNRSYKTYRTYKTGDLGRWLPGGTIEFSGRIDSQVKVRGYRIEPGEIENRLMGYHGIKECTVTAREDIKGSRYLCAYLVGNETVDTADLKEHLSLVLPEFMIPAYFVQLEKLPLGSTGKVDRSRLPDPTTGAEGDYVPPADEIEEKVVSIWSEVLGVGEGRIGRHANFFELGGHSLKATVMTSRIHKELKVKVPLVEVFSRQTLEALSDYIRNTSRQRFSPVEKAEEREYYALSAAQKRLFIIQQMEPAGTRYNMLSSFPVGKDIDKGRLESVFNMLIRRHESFRTCFFMKDDVPVQKILDAGAVDLSIGPGEIGGAFDLSRAPLLRVHLERGEGKENMLLVEMHHIISDGTSQVILEREFAALYSGEELPPLRLQYKDYSQWQNSGPQQNIMKAQEKYWLKEFSGRMPVLDLPLDFPRPPVQGYEGRVSRFYLNKALTGKLNGLSRATGATPYMILLSAFNILLSRLSGGEDIVIGTPIAARRHADLRDIIGMFVNTLAMRNYPGGDKRVIDFINEVKARTLEVYENQEYQFEDLVDKVSLKRDTGRHPVFDVLFNFLNLEDRAAGHWGTVPADPDMVEDGGESKALLDIVFQGMETDGLIYFTVNYCTKIYKEETIRRFIVYFKNIVSRMVDDTNITLSGIEILPEEEKDRLLYDFNNTAAEYPREKTIHKLFEEQAEKAPGHIALVGPSLGRGTTGTVSVTYGELNERSDRLAAVLNEKVPVRGGIVAVLVERSIEVITGMLAALKAGGAYLPIDPRYPGERIRFMLEDSGSRLLFTQKGMEEKIKVAGCEFIDAGNMDLYKGGHHTPVTAAGSPGDPAYVIYTSGSTGRPKGVMVEHGGLVNTISFLKRRFKSTGTDRFIQFTSVSFDASAAEIYTALLSSSSLYLPTDEIIANYEKLEVYLMKDRMTVAVLSPAYAGYLNPRRFVSLRLLITGGSAPTPMLVDKWDPWVEYINAYGPTETSICATAWFARENGKASYSNGVPIGKPIDNTRIYILDNRMNVQPMGVPGELYIGGAGMGRGYLNNPELTAEKFNRSYRTYKTGDRARWLPDGNLEFLGRVDHQVKLRGYRIELGEIENRLLGHDAVKEAVVTAVSDTDGDTRLCAYLVAGSVDHVDLREFLSHSLPEYMVPSHFVELTEMPLTPSGKVDRNALPAPDIRTGTRYRAPQNDIQVRLVEIWEEVLSDNSRAIGIDDDFFELGGHSLKAAALVSRIHKFMDVQLPLARVFKTPTVRGLAQYIAGAAINPYAAIQPVEKKEYYPLSSAQKRIYILQQMELESTAYNMPEIIPMAAGADVRKLEDTFIRLIQRHESLRTSFHMVEGQPVQKIHDNVEFSISKKEGRGAFDLSRAPLLRAGLVPGDGNLLLMVDMHHIISDGVSRRVLVKEFDALYRDGVLPPLRVQYKDYTQWQNSEKETRRLKRQEAYWLNMFGGEVPVLDLPFDFARPAVQGFEGSSLGFEVGSEATDSLKAMALEQGVTLYMVLLAVYTVFLAKIAGTEDIVIGTPVAGRGHADLENVIGMFVNTLVLRNFPDGEKPFFAFLDNVKERTLEAFDNRDYPFEDLVEKVSVNRDAGRNPLFDVFFVLQDSVDTGDTADIAAEEKAGAAPAADGFENDTAKFDLTLNGVEAGGKLRFSLGYSTRLFKRETIERFSGYLMKAVESIIEDPERQISRIDLLSPGEKRRLLHDFNDTAAQYPAEKTLHQLFEEQAGRTPDRVSLYMSRKTHLTYAELNETSGHLASLLRKKGVGPDTVVGIKMERSVEMVVGMLAILKAGGAYLPVDPQYPEARVKYMLKESGAGVLLSGVSRKIEVINSQPARLTHPAQPTHLCYIIYTSGSTGKPKGVAVEHRNAVNITAWFGRQYLQTGAHVLMMSDYTFDPSVNQVFGSLLHGAVLHIEDKERLVDIEWLRRYIKGRQINVLNFVPSLFNDLLGYGEKLESVRVVLSGGERLDGAVKDRIIEKGYDLYNQYGPTETTIDALVEKCTAAKVTLGTPVSNARCYIVDKYGNPVPTGVSGELCIAGAGVTRGYLNNPELTAERFNRGAALSKFLTPYPLPFTPIYRTGDRARWLPGGSVEFLGRMDDQLKIRGYRVEPGEIENRLSKYENIRECAVRAIDSDYLCAYIVSESGSGVSVSGLREYLAADLPAHMVPAHFIRLEKIPLTPNGKVDTRALPLPGTGTGIEYTAPGNTVESCLAGIWARVLGVGVGEIGIHDNFFQLGGQSLKAVIMIAAVHKETDVKLPLAEVFKRPTVKGLADYIMSVSRDKFTPLEPAEKREYYALSPAQKRMFILQQLEKESIVYNMPKRIVLEETPDIERLEKTFIALINRHESLRTSFHIVGDEPVQKIHDNVELSIGSPRSGAFDLSKAPLVRAGLIEREGSALLAVDMHHIISDGVSQKVLERDFAALYRDGTLAPLRIQYKDYALWQKAAAKESVERQGAYWLKEFEGEIPVSDIPTDFPRPGVRSFEGSALTFDLGQGETVFLNKTAREKGTTLFIVMTTVTVIFLSKITGQEDIVLGTVTAGRRHADLEQIIGMFVNTLALRNYPRGEQTFRDFLGDVNRRTLTAFENQEYPFEELVEKVVVNRDTGRNPLFDVMFSLLEPGDNEVLPGGENRDEDRISKFDLGMAGMETGDNIIMTVQYRTKLFKEETVRRFASYFKKIVSTIMDEPGVRLSEIEIISEEEKKRVLYEFNDTRGIYPQDSTGSTVHGLFGARAEKMGDNIALVGMDGHITYRELDMMSNRLARVLQEKGLGPGRIAAVLMGQSVDMAAGVLGILKAGGAYLPIAPHSPADRIHHILADSNARLILTHRRLTENVTVKTEIIDFEDHKSRGAAPLTGAGASDLAYVIYTSGTTGRPKGVPVEHRGIVNTLVFRREEYRMGPSDTALQLLSYAFDAFVTSFFTPLISGTPLVLMDEEGARDVESIREAVVNHRIAYVAAVAPLFQAIMETLTASEASVLKTVVLGGERISHRLLELVRQKNRDLELVNEYGVTEAAVLSTLKRHQESDDRISVGRPIWNTGVYILNGGRCLQPVGVAGELCISGTGLARGYLNNPELTNSKFQITNYNPFLTSAGTPGSYRTYKTGDRARWLPDGSLEFLGRMDRQIKVRGYRIELGEIEARLAAHKAVKGACVISREVSGDTQICAYILCNVGAPVSGELKEYLSRVLPGYMIPNPIIELEAFPLTPNGKIDYNALPAPAAEAGAAHTYVAPRDEIEEKLAAIWRDVLFDGSDIPIGIEDNFFRLGGHSLKATLMASKIYNAFDVRVPLVEVFKDASIKHMARIIKEEGKHIPVKNDDTVILLKRSRAEIPRDLFLIHDGTGEVDAYIELCNRSRDTGFNCWGIRAGELKRYGLRNLSIPVIAAEYIRKIKRIRDRGPRGPRGPYYLAGWSLGGAVAFEMALQLERAGEEPGFLVLIDSVPPRKPGGKPVNEGAPGIKEQDHYKDTIRRLGKAFVKYVPGGKSKAHAHFIGALGSRIKNAEHWGDHFENGLRFHTVPGDHYSIFKEPGIDRLSELFPGILISENE